MQNAFPPHNHTPEKLNFCCCAFELKCTQSQTVCNLFANGAVTIAIKCHIMHTARIDYNQRDFNASRMCVRATKKGAKTVHSNWSE